MPQPGSSSAGAQRRALSPFLHLPAPAVAALALLAFAPAAPAATLLPAPFDLTFTGNPATVDEGDSFTVDVNIINAQCAPFSVDWSTTAVGSGTDPAEPRDLGLPFPSLVTFTDTNGTVSVTVPTIADADADDETVTLTLTPEDPSSLGCNGQVPQFPDYSVQFRILDDDAPAATPTARISSSLSVGVTEGDAGDADALVTVTVELLDPPAAPYSLNVKLGTLAQSAAPPGDYDDFLATVNFSNGSPGPFNFAIHVNGDNVPEPSEDFLIKLFNPDPGIAIHADHAVTVTIGNDDATPRIAVLDLGVVEGSGGGSPNRAVTIQVSDAPVGVPMNIDWHTDSTGATEPATPGVDYQTSGGTVQLTAGSSVDTIAVQVPVVADSDPEPDESFFVKVTSGEFGALLDDPVGEVTIDDDDVLVLPDAAVSSDGPVVEGDSGTTMMTFAVTIVGPTPAPGSSVDFHTEDDTALAGEDYVPTSGTLHFGPSLPTTQNIQVPVKGDLAVEGLETFFVVIDNPAGMTISTAKATGTIDDDDSPLPPSQVSIEGVALDEGDAGQTTFNFKVTLDTPSASPLTFAWKTVDGTATSGSGDYVAVTSGNGFIPANTTSIELPVLVNGDNLVEDDETFRVELSEIAGGVFANNQANASVRNDDTEGEYSFSVGDLELAEGNAGLVTATFTVTLSANHGGAPTVAYATEAGSATAGSDFVATSGTLAFADGATSRTVSVDVIGDTAVEPDESFSLKLSNPTGGAAIADDTGVATVTNDDAATPAQPILSIADAQLAEGDQGGRELTFVLRLDGPAEGPVSADFATFDGSATTADGDYQAKTGQVGFAAGSTQASLTVVVAGDTRVEADETFGVRLSNVAGATLGRGEAQGRIVNDDQPSAPQDRSTIRLARAEAVGEGAGFAVVVVERTGEAVGAASARVTVAAGTATAGEDFTPVSVEVAWAAGLVGEREVRVPLLADNLVEADETLRVSVGEVRGAQAGQPLAATLTLLDDDSAVRLEAVGAAERDATVGDEIDLQVRAVRADGVPVAGALIDFEALSGPVRLVGEGPARSDAEGVATQKVAVGPAPGAARVRAVLRGTSAEVSFALRVLGNLGELAVGTGGNLNVGDILDQSCAAATGELAELCGYVYGLGDPVQQRQALAEMTPQGVAAQLRAALQAPKNQNRNVGSRLDALRGGAPQQTLDQLALSVQGQSLGGFGALQEALLRGAATSAAAPRRGAPAPGLDSGLAYETGRDRAWEERQGRRDRAKIDLALQKASPGAFRLAKQDAQGSADRGDDPTDGTESPWGMFVNGRMSFGDAPRRGVDPGYDFETEGLTAGVDYRVSSQFVVGAALGWVSTGSELADGGAIDTDGFSLNLYGTWYREQWYVEGVLGYGRNDYRLKRVIVLPQPFAGRDAYVAVGSPDSDQLSAELGAGYDFRVGRALGLTGFGRLGYVDTAIDAYEESGGGAFDLGFAGQDLDSLLGEVGVELTYPWSVGWGVLQPLLRVSWLHEFEDDAQVVRARFLGDGAQRYFVVRSEQPDRDYLNLAAGISATLPRGWATFLQYDTDLEREELDIYTLSGGFRFQF